MDAKKDTPPQDHAIAAVELLGDYYSPALSFGDATDYMTTDDVIEFVADIRPGLYLDSEEIVQQMRAARYHYDLIAPGQLRWLLRAVG